MDEQEEYKGEMQRATQNDDDVNDKSQRDQIPLDLTLEILSRLPAKSIVRSLCVSKLWSSFTTLPSFIKSYATRSSARPPSLLLILVVRGKQFVFSFPQHQNPDGSYSPVDSYQTRNIKEWESRIIPSSVQGLILSRSLVIWNPTIRRYLTLPQPKTKNWKRGMFVLGYDPLEHIYKVLYVPTRDSYEQPQVLTLGAQESWRIISKGSPSHGAIIYWPQSFNGFIYYENYFGGGGGKSLVSFDVRSEKFNSIKLPDGTTPSHRIVFYEGRLALVSSVFFLDIIDLWILKDANEHEWTYKCFCVSDARKRNISFRGVSDAGEFVFAPWDLGSSNSYYILYFDPRRNSVREALFEGIMGDEFRCRYGLGSTLSSTSSVVIPNHFESLVAL